MIQFLNIDRVAQFTQIATLISVIIGTYVAVSSTVDTLNSSDISDVNNVKPLVSDDLSIRKKMVVYMKNQMDDDIGYIKQAIEKGESGESLFYSDRLSNYQEITAYYENLGSILKWENMEFKIIFDMLAFPDNFYLKTKEVRQLIAANWHGQGVPLQDFFSDFDALCVHYQDKRADQGLRHLKLEDCQS